jgi:hypothetical protein
MLAIPSHAICSVLLLYLLPSLMLSFVSAIELLRARPCLGMQSTFFEQFVFHMQITLHLTCILLCREA